MEFNEVIKRRKSTREYKKGKISQEVVLQLLDAARLAPSAANRQPWHYVVLEDKKDDIANIMASELDKKEHLDKNKYATKEYCPTSSLIGSIKLIRQASILILVFRNKDEDWKDGDFLSIGASLEHIHLKATDLGLASIWLRDVIYRQNDICNYFGYKDMELVCGLVVGYDNEEPYERKKKQLNEIVTYY